MILRGVNFIISHDVAGLQFDLTLRDSGLASGGKVGLVGRQSRCAIPVIRKTEPKGRPREHSFTGFDPQKNVKIRTIKAECGDELRLSEYSSRTTI
jgi:hypothetical protein